MDRLTLFGLFAVSAMLVCYALEDRSPWFVLAFAGAVVGGVAEMVEVKPIGGFSRMQVRYRQEHL